MASLSFAISGVVGDAGTVSADPVVVGAGIGSGGLGASCCCGGLGASCCCVDGTAATIASHSTTTIAAAARTLRKVNIVSIRMSLGFNAEQTIKFPAAPAKPTEPQEPQSNATHESHLPQASNIAINQRERV